MTSTTSERFLRWFYLIYFLPLVVALSVISCAAPTPQTRVVPPAAPKQEPAAPAAESPYYGSTYWDELLTSVYYYPHGSDGAEASPPVTHLKFDHREDDIWLCGDQRRNFAPGNKYKLLVTFEPNQPCVTNWKIE